MKSLLIPAFACLALSASTGLVQAGEPYVAPPPMPTPEESAWSFGLAIYGWGAGLDGDVSVSGHSADIDSSFSDILDNLDFGIMVSASAHSNRFSLYADFVYLALSADGELRKEAGYDHLELEMDAFIGTLIGMYRVIDEPGGFLEIGGGGRVLYTDTDFKLSDRRNRGDEIPHLRPTTFGDSNDNWDGVGAIRAGLAFGGGWVLSLYGDVGAGDSDITWQVAATLGYWFTENFGVAGGYRRLAYEWDGHDDDELDISFSGPVLGVFFKF